MGVLNTPFLRSSNGTPKRQVKSGVYPRDPNEHFFLIDKPPLGALTESDNTIKGIGLERAWRLHVGAAGAHRVRACTCSRLRS